MPIKAWALNVTRPRFPRPRGAALLTRADYRNYCRSQTTCEATNPLWKLAQVKQPSEHAGVVPPGAV